MKKTYNNIANITKTIGVTKENNLCKLMEEIGELSQNINIEFGIKNGILNINNIKGELADCIQILMSISNQYGITYNELVLELGIKNNKWLKKYKAKAKIKIRITSSKKK